MAYTAPTAAEVKARYPEFANVSDPRVAAFIEEANRFVDDSWLEADYKIAIQALTAHMMAAEGLLNPDGGTPAGGTTGPVRSETLGDASITYADRSTAASGEFDADLDTTPYGVRFKKIRRGNFPAVMVV